MSLHPLSTAISRINAIFYDLGFEFAEGPLVESEYYNFDALNVVTRRESRVTSGRVSNRTKDNPAASG